MSRYREVNYEIVQIYEEANSILVEFEVKNFKRLKVSEGMYANPYSDCWDDYIKVKEICIPSYSLTDLTPVTWSFAGEGVKYGFDNYNL